MKVLWICPYLPFPANFGGSIRVFYLLRELAKHSQIDLAILDHERAVDPKLGQYVNEVHFFSPDRSRRVAQAIALATNKSHFELSYRSANLNKFMREDAEDYDVVIVESTQLAFIDLPVNPIKVLNMHNIEFEVMRRSAEADGYSLRGFYRRYESGRLEQAEREVVKRYDVVAVCSRREQRLIESWDAELIGSVVTIPNGVLIENFLAETKAEEPVPDLFFVGTMNYFPNSHGIEWFHNEVWPLIKAKRPNMTFGCIGGGAPEDIKRFDSEDFRMYGFVESIQPFFQHCKALVVPLLSGGGTRLKILEGAAARTPMVTTAIGCEGLNMKHGKHALIATTAEAFADYCIQVVEDREAALERVEASFDWVRANYDWTRIASSLKRVIQRELAVPAGLL